MEPLENPYAVLGLPQDAGASDAPGFDAELRKAYRKKALLFHPDKNVNKPAAEREAAAASWRRSARATASSSSSPPSCSRVRCSAWRGSSGSGASSGWCRSR